MSKQGGARLNQSFASEQKLNQSFASEQKNFNHIFEELVESSAHAICIGRLRFCFMTIRSVLD
jgi:hypothetical protein